MLMFFKKKEKKENIILSENIQNENKAEKYSPVKDFFWEVVKVVVISLAIVLPVRRFLIQPFYVKGASMEPNFYDHEYLIVNEIDYHFRNPARGDIIVFRYPYDIRQYFIKRIVGLPGERIKIENGDIYVFNKKYSDGTKLDETEYLSAGVKTAGKIDVVLKADEYFVLGDNRAASLDSRSFGPIPFQNIVGRTWIRGWPFDRVLIFEKPDYKL